MQVLQAFYLIANGLEFTAPTIHLDISEHMVQGTGNFLCPSAQGFQALIIKVRGRNKYDLNRLHLFEGPIALGVQVGHFREIQACLDGFSADPNGLMIRAGRHPAHIALGIDFIAHLSKGSHPA